MCWGFNPQSSCVGRWGLKETVFRHEDSTFLTGFCCLPTLLYGVSELKGPCQLLAPQSWTL